MAISIALQDRSEGKCELCSNETHLLTYVVPPKTGDNENDQIAICQTCKLQVEGDAELDINHWRCLNESIWNPTPAVQVVANRMLHKLDVEDWAQDLLGMMYMDEVTTEWAGAMDDADIHKDANGVPLKGGDNVVLIKDLVVKGANFTAKRGTAVRRISLINDNTDHIQGKINGQTIIIITKFVKKS